LGLGSIGLSLNRTNIRCSFRGQKSVPLLEIHFLKNNSKFIQNLKNPLNQISIINKLVFIINIQYSQTGNFEVQNQPIGEC